MFIQVYFHKTRRYLDRLLVQSISEILPGGKYPLDLNAYLKLDDVEVLHLIKKSDTTYCKQYCKRELMTCVRETSAHANKSERQLFKVICHAVQNNIPSDLAFVDEVDKAAHKLQPLLLAHEDDSGKEIKIIDKHSGVARNIMEDSLILEGIVKPISICRLYVNKSELDRAREIIKNTCDE